MKATVDEKDIVKHWGIWNVVDEYWMSDMSGAIFHFTCPRVANAQHQVLLDEFDWTEQDIEVKEIK